MCHTINDTRRPGQIAHLANWESSNSFIINKLLHLLGSIGYPLSSLSPSNNFKNWNWKMRGLRSFIIWENLIVRTQPASSQFHSYRLTLPTKIHRDPITAHPLFLMSQLYWLHPRYISITYQNISSSMAHSFQNHSKLNPKGLAQILPTLVLSNNVWKVKKK